MIGASTTDLHPKERQTCLLIIEEIGYVKRYNISLLF